MQAGGGGGAPEDVHCPLQMYPRRRDCAGVTSQSPGNFGGPEELTCL